MQPLMEFISDKSRVIYSEPKREALILVIRDKYKYITMQVLFVTQHVLSEKNIIINYKY